jgi:L-Ala-D/L-Glu epimerase
LTELRRFDIADAEQPLARGDLKSLAELRRTVGIPIAAQESVSSPEDALAVLEEKAADLLKIKLTHIGGFQRGSQVAAVVGAKVCRWWWDKEAPARRFSPQLKCISMRL